MGRLPGTPEEEAAVERAMAGCPPLVHTKIKLLPEEEEENMDQYVCPEGEGNKDTNPKDIIGSNKPGITSVPMQVMAEVGNAMLEGQKYGRHNYRAAGVRASIYVDAVWRHLFLQWWDQGEDIDEPSGLNHVTKAITSLIVIRDSMLQGNFVDDRPPKAKLTMEELQEKCDGVLESLEKSGVLPPWTEKRMNDEKS